MGASQNLEHFWGIDTRGVCTATFPPWASSVLSPFFLDEESSIAWRAVWSMADHTDREKISDSGHILRLACLDKKTEL